MKRMSVEDLNKVEDKIRAIVFKNRIRIYQFFKDFDKLNSGYVNREQFKRVLAISDIDLTSEENEILLKVYFDENRQKVHYSKFVDNIDKVFTKKQLEKNPREELYSIKPLLEATKAPKEIRQMEKLKCLLERMKKEADIQGYIVKHFFKDFDVHHHGIITRSQFLQCLPFKNLNEQELNLIFERYKTESGDINYSQFSDEIEGIQEVKPVRSQEKSEKTVNECDVCDANSVEQLIQKLVVKYRIKIDERFRDYDPLRTGYITKDQFMSSLGSVKIPKISLTRKELNVLAEKYRVEDLNSQSRVAYREFLNNVNQGGVKSTVDALQSLEISTKNLSENEEKQLSIILERIRHEIYTKRVLLKPLFKDFDRSQKGIFSTHHVNRTHFSRVLSILGLTFSNLEYSLLANKYDDLQDGSVNYILFLEDVDGPYNDEPFMSKTFQSNFRVTSKPEVKKKHYDYKLLMEELLFIVYRDRVRLKEFMKDFDLLRTGLITVSQFRSGLSMAGIKLSDEEFEILKNEFISTRRHNSIRYKDFCDQLIFNEKELEKHPKKDTMSVTSFMESQEQKQIKKDLYDTKEVRELLEKLRQYFKTRRVLIEPHFSDFDKHKSGKVSQVNFRRVLDKIFKFNVNEYELLEKLYSDQNGDISYTEFVGNIETFETRNKEQSQTNKEHEVLSCQKENEVNIEQVLKEVRSQVKKNRIRLKDFFTDYDKLHHGLCTVQKFRTGLAMTNIILTDIQRKVLEEYFKSRDEDVEMVNYLNFCSYIDSTFVDMELMTKPTKKLNEFAPLPRLPLMDTVRPLSFETIKQYEKVMRKICYLTKTQNIILKPYFQDYELIRRERVTRTQFASVLDKLKLKLEKDEVDALIQKYLDIQAEVDYVSFCKDVENQNGTTQSFTS